MATVTREMIEAANQRRQSANIAAVRSGFSRAELVVGQRQASEAYLHMLRAWGAQSMSHAPAEEPVQLADGPAVQSLIPGVAAVNAARRAIATEAARRQARRGHAAPPAGGLFDDAARRQGDLF